MWHEVLLSDVSMRSLQSSSSITLLSNGRYFNIVQSAVHGDCHAFARHAMQAPRSGDVRHSFLQHAHLLLELSTCTVSFTSHRSLRWARTHDQHLHASQAALIHEDSNQWCVLFAHFEVAGPRSVDAGSVASGQRGRQLMRLVNLLSASACTPCTTCEVVHGHKAIWATHCHELEASPCLSAQCFMW